MAEDAGADALIHVVVDGDVIVEWNLATGPSPFAPDGTRVSHQFGGAALLAEVLLRVAEESGRKLDIRRPATRDARPDDTDAHHSWTLWSRVPKGGGWRVDRALGTALAALSPRRDVDDGGGGNDVRLVALHDGGLGFRERTEQWPAAIAAEASGLVVVLSTRAPVARGALWEHLLRRRGDRLVVVVGVDDLRRSNVQISRGLSWERTAQDLLWELTHNPDIRSLSQCSHVVVSFGAAGAVVVSRPDEPAPSEDDQATCSLVFDPTAMEGEWEQERPGAVVGSTELLTGFIANAFIDSTDHVGLCQAVIDGVGAVRRLHDAGYALDGDGRLEFPFARVFDGHAQHDESFACTAVRDPAHLLSKAVTQPGDAAHGYWTILEDTYPEALGEVSEEVVVRGAQAVLRAVPHGRFGKLFTVDRHEIEALRAIRGLMAEYCMLEQPDRPLSIAVFGPPGSGKSFGVVQVANSLLPGRLQKLEFNLSQFESPDELIDALHQVRDVSLAGKIPLVFWDEFDTPLHGTPLGWLRYFLAPMQDGAFRQGQLVHPIGRALFVFAGGTSATMHDFGSDLTPAELRAAKKPDFASRLRGYLDVLGPNPHAAPGELGTDRFHELRRAILLDSLLRRKAPQLASRLDGEDTLAIDPGLLRAFLQIPAYRHGARSMEAIIDMSHLSGQRSFQRSSLPSESQLDLHVDGRRFLALVQRPDLSGDMLEQLAIAAHHVFCASLVQQGYRRGAVADEAQKLSPKLCPYEELSEADKEQNRANVRDIPNKLAHAGYLMLAAKSEQVNAAFHRQLVEELAQREHERWMADKLARGWVRGAPTDEQARRHEALLPWEELSESQREKDRSFVTGISEILRRCGYAVLPVAT